jgi:Sec-independent protein translocase protein TatA
MLEFGSLIEIFIIFVAALLLLGPKEIPVVFRFLGRLVYKVRSMTSGFRGYIDHHMQTGELDAFTKDAFSKASSSDDSLRSEDSLRNENDERWNN